MAHITTHTPIQPGSGVFRRAGNAIRNGLIRTSKGGARFRQVEFLMSLSDEELAKRKIARNDIVRHVFRDALHA